METLTMWTTLEYDEGPKEDGTWRPPRVAKADATEQAAAMVDRFHRIMMRTLRALRDLRRYSSKVVVQNAAQVNIGDKQINVTEERGRP
jgi:hypothetical protein